MPSPTAHNETTITFPVVKINGANLETSMMDRMLDLVIDSSMNMPDMVVVTFDDERLELINGDSFPLGGKIEIELSSREDPRQTKPVFKGEIVAIEPEFLEGMRAVLVVRGYDKSHRLHRETQTKVWTETKDSDIASTIAGNAGLSAQVDTTTEVYKHVFQDAQTDMAFLQQRAERIGYEVFVQDEKLYFRKPDPSGNAVELEWGENLISFRPRLTVANQVNEVTVKGWDPLKKEAIVGKATSSKTSPEIGLGEWGGSSAQSALSAAKKLQVRHPVQSQADADNVAKAILNDINSGFIEAEGEALGVPDLKAGMLVKVTSIGSKFSGKYKLTAVRHVYTADGFTSHFTVEGARPQVLSRLLADQRTSAWSGVVPAIVTNNEDQENDWGHIKVKYPWLDDSKESFWARLTGPGMGAERGIYFMPEVNDEVLVAFEHGDFNRPYIIGGLYNGKDKPADPLSAVVASGKVKTRTIRTRTGHVIRFVDEDSGQEHIEIIDAKQKTSIKMDTANETITVKSSKDIAIEAQSNINIKAGTDISLNADGQISIAATRGLILQGQNVDLSAKTSASLKANSSMSIQGATLSAQGSASTEVKGGANLTLSGAIIRIN
ncbi:MAG: VgrG-related protein [Chloroflexi bacterium]|nr:VgrG-related protein [Chloroflexota bacterium]